MTSIYDQHDAAFRQVSAYVRPNPMRHKITWSGAVAGGSWVVFDADRDGGDGWAIMPSQALFHASSFDECAAWIDRQQEGRKTTP